MIPLEFVQAIGDVRELIKAGKQPEALQKLDRISQHMLSAIGAMPSSDRMEVLGAIALRYRECGATDKEVPFLEQLCEIARQDLNTLGPMASSEDIARTATDMLLLGVAYLKIAKNAEAHRQLIEAAKLFGEIGWEIDVEGMIHGKSKSYVGPKGGREQVLKQAPESPGSCERPALVSYNFKGGGRCYIYFP